MKAIIVGGGQVGAYIASVLIQNKLDVKVIENREGVFEKLKKNLPLESIVFGDGTNAQTLEACGIAEADVVVAVTGADEINLLVSTLAKFEYGVPRVIARVNNPRNAWLFKPGMGVDASLNQADVMAKMVISEMDLTNLLTLMNIKQTNFSIVEVPVLFGSCAIGKPVKDLKLPQDSVLIAINRGSDLVIPKGDTVIQDEDEIVALVNDHSREDFNALFSPK